MANEFKIKKGLIVTGADGTLLDVQGDSGQVFSVTDNLVGDIFSVSDISGIPIFNVNSTGVVDIDGKLGIGTDNPATALEVLGNITLREATDNTETVYINTNSRGLGTSDADLRIGNTNHGDVLTIHNQRAGIGQTSPLSTLHIEEAVTGDNSQFRITNGAGATFRMGITGNGADQAAHIKTNSSENLEFHIGQASDSATPRVIFTSTGNVGIGTASPGAKLHVSNGTSGLTGAYNSRTTAAFESNISTGSTISIISKNTGYSGIFFGDEDYETTGQLHFNHTDNSFKFINNGGLERMRITSDGNVGIGTTSPGYQLETTGTIRSTGIGSAPSTGSGIELRYTTDGAGSILAYNRTTGSTGYLPIRVEGDTIDLREGGNSRLYIDGGNVGIGTTSPGQKLDVRNGTITSRDDSNTNYAELDRFVGLTLKGNGTSSRIIKTPNNDALTFGTNNTEHARVDKDGNVGIGTTDPQAKFDVHGTSGQLFSVTDNLVGNIFSVSDISGIPILNVNSTGIVNVDGKLGVGTDDPASDLHIKTSVDNSVSQGIIIERSINSDRGYINYNGGGFQFRSTIGDPIVFGETDAEHMRIKPDGNVGIGITDPYYKLHVEFENTDTTFTGGTGGNWGGQGIRIENTSNVTNSMSTIHLRNNNSDIHIAGIRQGADDSDLGIFFESVEKFRINSDGDVSITGDISANNLSGTNTGDQDLSGYALTSHTHDDRYYTESEIQTFFNRGYISNQSATDLAIGWYTIATNTGDRALGEFQIWDIAGSRHQSVLFNASHHYGVDTSNDITVLANSRFGTDVFRYIRIKENSTYDGAALQVYIDNATNAVRAAITGANAQESGWVLKDWIADATDPGDVDSYSSFTEKCKIDLDNTRNGGLETTGNLIAQVGITGDDITTNTLSANGNVFIGGTLSMEDSINMTSNGRIINLEDPSDDQDAATKNYVDSYAYSKSASDARFVNVTGDTMTGILTMNAGSTAQPIDITGSNSSYTAIAIKNTGGGNAGLYIDAINGDLSGSDYLFVGQDDSGYANYNIGSSSPMPYHVFTGGNVGIGTNSPDSKLHIDEGDITISGFNTSRFIRFTEPDNSFQGAFINYDGSGNVFYIGTHNTDDVLTSSDVRAISISRGSANVVVEGSVYSKGNNFVFGSSTSEGEYIQRSGNDIRFIAGGSTRMTIDGDAGYVGIGTTDPAFLLDVNEDDNVVAFRVTGGGGGSAMASFVRDVGATGSQININAQNNFPQIQFVNTGNTFAIGGDTSGNFKISDNAAIGTNDRITIDNTGNVGIGTDDPGAKLQINNATTVGSTSSNLSGLNPILYLDAGQAAGRSIVLKNHTSGDNTVVGALRFAASPDGSNYSHASIEAKQDGNATVDTLEFRTSSSNTQGAANNLAMIIEGTDVGIGTTSPSIKLDVVDASASRTWSHYFATVAAFERNGDSIVNIVSGNTGNASLWFGRSNSMVRGRIRYEQGNDKMELWTANAPKAYIDSSGNLHATADVVAYSSSVSDIRLKDNINTIDSALNKVKKLRGVEYTWNAGSRKDKKDLGVIAQEVEEVLPEIVHEHKMDLIDEQVYKTVDYEKITAVLIEAIKEQQKQIDELKNQLDAFTK